MSKLDDFYWHVGADQQLQATMPEHWVEYLRVTRGNLPFDRFGGKVIAPNQVMHECSVWRPPQNRVTTPYGDICIRRAGELLKRGRPLFVYWSGGIDSTTVLASLFHHDFPDDQLNIVMNESSKREHYRFYKRFIEGKYSELNTVGAASILNALPEGEIITGELNDQLFGSDVMHAIYLRCGFDILLKKPTREGFAWAMGMGHSMNVSSALSVYDAIMESAAAINRPLHNLFDVFWFANFCFKWQNVNFRMFAYDRPEAVKNLRPQDFKRVHHFFGTDEFQTWSWSGHEKKHDGDWRSYKITAKRFLFRFDGDQNYLDHGVKLISLRPRDVTFGALTTGYQFIEKERG